MLLRAVQEGTDVLIDDSLTSGDWISASAILLGGIVAAVITSQLLRRVIAHGIGPGFASIMLARVASYAVFLVSLFYALTTLGVRVGPLLGALGLGGLVLALALQSVVENFVSSIILQARRPFTIGDTVELDGHVGIVADIDARTTLVRSLEGTQVRVPNAKVLSSTIVNLTREPIRRSTLEVGVAYDTDLQRARDALQSAVDRVPRILDEPAPMLNLTGFGESSIGFSILYWHASDVPSELATRTDLTIAVHQAFAAEDITIAFPQVVVWSGSDSPVPYDQPPQNIATSYPSLDSSNPPKKKRIGPQLGRTNRRKERE